MKAKVISLLLALCVFGQAAEVTIKTPTGELHATLEAIEGELKNVVIIIPGSGPTDRDGNNPMLSGKNNSLKYLADFLRGEKISSLRIDKRGVAASAKEISKLKVPILIIHGDTDIQIPIQAAKSLHAGASGSKLEIINGMNHALKAATQEKKSQDAAYTDPKIPLHPRLGKVIVDFVK